MKLRQYKHSQIVDRDRRRKFFLRECMRCIEKKKDKKRFGERYNHVFRSARKAWCYHWCIERMGSLPF